MCRPNLSTCLLVSSVFWRKLSIKWIITFNLWWSLFCILTSTRLIWITTSSSNCFSCPRLLWITTSPSNCFSCPRLIWITTSSSNCFSCPRLLWITTSSSNCFSCPRLLWITQAQAIASPAKTLMDHHKLSPFHLLLVHMAHQVHKQQIHMELRF